MEACFPASTPPRIVVRTRYGDNDPVADGEAARYLLQCGVDPNRPDRRLQRLNFLFGSCTPSLMCVGNLQRGQIYSPEIRGVAEFACEHTPTVIVGNPFI